jgi:hypothetical protein
LVDFWSQKPPFGPASNPPSLTILSSGDAATLGRSPDANASTAATSPANATHPSVVRRGFIPPITDNFMDQRSSLVFDFDRAIATVAAA